MDIVTNKAFLVVIHVLCSAAGKRFIELDTPRSPHAVPQANKWQKIEQYLNSAGWPKDLSRLWYMCCKLAEPEEKRAMTIAN